MIYSVYMFPSAFLKIIPPTTALEKWIFSYSILYTQCISNCCLHGNVRGNKLRMLLCTVGQSMSCTIWAILGIVMFCVSIVKLHICQNVYASAQSSYRPV